MIPNWNFAPKLYLKSSLDRSNLPRIASAWGTGETAIYWIENMLIGKLTSIQIASHFDRGLRVFAKLRRRRSKYPKTQRRNLAPHDTPRRDRFAHEVFLTTIPCAHCGQVGCATKGARFLRCVVGSLRSLDHFGRNDMLLPRITGQLRDTHD
jgi:hypothetical protein